MIFNRKHFPILFSTMLVISLLCSCQKRTVSSSDEEYKVVIEKAEKYYYSGDYNNAYIEYFKIKSLCKEDQADKIVYAYFRLADILNKTGDYSECETTATEAFKYFEKCKKQVYINAIYNCLGINYLHLKDYKNSLLFYNKALINSSSVINQLTVKNNIAVVYLQKGNNAKAVEILQSIIEHDSLKADKVEYARALDNLGYAKFKLNDSSDLKDLAESYKIRMSENNDFDITASLMHLSEYYLNQKPKLSIQYGLKAYQAATRVNNPDDRLEALDFLIKNASGNEFKKYYRIHSSLNDSIINVRQSAKNQFAKIKYDFKDNLQKYELQKTKSYLYLALLILISVLASFIIVAIRKRNREKIKTISYETETRIAKKIHDELANDVFNALTFAESQNLNDPNKKEALLDNLDTIYNRTRNISRENSEIQTDSQFDQQLTDLLLQYQNDNVRVIIQDFSTINWDDIKKEAKIAIYRVLQELMVNMKKHSECTFVILKFSNLKSHIEIEYKDNGKGAEMLNSKKGLQNAENRINAIKGTITFDFETEKGFKASIKIPK